MPVKVIRVWKDEFDIRDARVPESEREYENALRPLSFHDFSGQAKVVENLKIFVMAAGCVRRRSTMCCCMDLPDWGKTTLSNIIANELGVGFKVTSGPVLDKPGDLAGVLTSLEKNDVLFYRRDPPVESDCGGISVFGDGRLPDRYHDR